MKIVKRNLSSSFDAVGVGSDDPIWTDWTVANAVKDGYKASGWVYKAVSLISRNAANAPFVVKNKDNEVQWEHPITKLLLKPHPTMNRIQFYELLFQWLELAGNAYIKKADGAKITKELWPVSPDRMAPKESSDNSLMVDGYKTLNDNGAWEDNPDFTIENMIHIALTNPAQPLLGIAPLQAVAKTVDADVAQQGWNASAMQNRGVVEGVFTFKTPLDKIQSTSIVKRIMDKFSGGANARKPLVIGSDATYTRLSLTAAEMDFLNSRKFNRDEIFVVFGVPPQLAGAMESSTFNNYSESMRIFWDITLIPLLKMVATQFTNAFADQLGEGYYVSYDLSDIDAVRENESDKAVVAKSYYDIGIPVMQINEKFELGFEEYIGWDLPFNGLQKQTASTDKKGDEEERKLVLIPVEERDAKKEAESRRKISDGPAQSAYEDLLKRQGEAVFGALKRNESPVDAAKAFHDELVDLTRNVIVGVAMKFAETTVVDQRGQKLDFENRGNIEEELIGEFLLEEQVILQDVSAIDNTTTKIIMEQISDASEKGFDYNELRKALEDTGLFSPERALRIARTEVGTAASIGQLASATVAGADYKMWETSGTETRPAHVARSGEEVKMDERFSAQISAVGPRFPLDPQIDVADRVNCDCFMTFRVD